MKKYIAISFINNMKFYLKKNGDWEQSYDNLKIYLEDQVGKYFCNKKRTYILKTKFSLNEVEEYIN